jgi:DNA replication protein DnaC
MKNQTEALEHASVKQYCKAVRVPTVGANFISLAEQAVKENQSHIRYLEALLAIECEERDRHAIANRIRDAQLPRLKTLEEFDFAQAPLVPAAKIRELAEGGYIERSEPVLLIGECGTGKSHLATGLCLAACRQKRRVRFTTAAALVNELVEAKQNNQVRRLMARWQKYELIALDEVGYVPLADIGAEFLFQVISERAERAAIIVTTNLLCGAPHKRFNAESIFMRTPRSMESAGRHCVVFWLRILGAAFSISISLSVALKRPVRSFGAITDSRASSFTDGSARV